MSDIEAQANAIVLRAKDQANRILAEAQRIGDELKKRAFENGLNDGKQTGFKQGLIDGHAAGLQEALNEHRLQLSQLIETLVLTATQLNDSRRLLESQACVDVLRLAIAIARRATKKIGISDPSVVTENVREAMKLAVRASDIRIAVHPTQKQALEESLPRLKMDWPQLEHVTVVEDAQLSAGGCRIFTAGGMIDADLDEQIDRIANDLLPNLGAADERR